MSPEPRKTAAGWVLVLAAASAVGLTILPMIYGFLIWTGWIGR
jgi:hypothetical protein